MAALSGMPADQAKRVVVIAQRQLKALQSGQRLAHQWQITWKHTERWSNPLMGWTSTADPMSNVKLSFETKEAAIAFAERNGWKFEVKAATSKTNTTPGTYLYKHNFLDKRVSFFLFLFLWSWSSNFFLSSSYFYLRRRLLKSKSLDTNQKYSSCRHMANLTGSCL